MLKNKLFFLLCFFTIFNCIPRAIRFGFLAGPVQSQLVFFPLIIGLFYTAYCVKNKQLELYDIQKFNRYLLTYGLITFVSLGYGLIKYPYYDLILNGPTAQIDKLPVLLNWLNSHGVILSEKVLVIPWLICRVFKELAFELLYFFCGSYIIYCWYYDNWDIGWRSLIKGIKVSLMIICSYSIIEFFFLGHAAWAGKILAVINPYIHDIKGNGTWWPPLLWNGQFRSVFAEPSYFGIYIAFALPFLWSFLASDVNKKTRSMYFVITVFVSFLLFLTKARTGFLIHLGELSLLLFLMLLSRYKLWMKSFVIIVSCSVIGFFISTLFINNVMNTKETMALEHAMVDYIDSNAGSLANPDKRSNRARYSIMEADFKIGLDHPVLGVGSGLRNGYIPDYLSDKAKDNNEVKMWLAFREKLGILKSGFPKLGEYTSRFGENGILGLLLFVFPAFNLLVQMLKKIRESKDLRYIFFTVSFCGILASGIGDTINITYCYWILLGLGYAMCYGKSGEEIKEDKHESA